MDILVKINNKQTLILKGRRTEREKSYGILSNYNIYFVKYGASDKICTEEQTSLRFQLLHFMTIRQSESEGSDKMWEGVGQDPTGGSR